MNSDTENNFIEKIDCNFPYQDKQECPNLIDEAEALSKNAINEPTPMTKMKELVIDKGEKLESRINKVIHYLHQNHPESWLQISFIDATGKIGNKFTQLLNENTSLKISFEEFKEMCEEDGQILDGTIEVLTETKRLGAVSVVVGRHVDVKGFEDLLPNEVIGKYIEIEY